MRIFSAIGFLAICYVILDFSIDLRPAGIQDSYRFKLDKLGYDQPQWLQRDNLTILVIRRSGHTVRLLRENLQTLQDPYSKQSNQPASSENTFRSQLPEYFVSSGLGTYYGCQLESKAPGVIGEVCSDAEYDFAGRALSSKNTFQNLPVPDYNFSNDYTTLTVKP